MPFLGFLLTGFACGACAWLARGRGWARLGAALDQSRQAHCEALRVMQLAGRDLNDAALRLHGQAGAWRNGADPAACAGFAALAERCRLLAGDLAAAAPPGSQPTLEEDVFDLLACVREAAAATAASLAPGKRVFRLPPEEDTAFVMADRRALRQVLGRVLTEAALNTNEADWITAACRQETDRLELTVADEGSGLGVQAGHGPAPRDRSAPGDSRGLGAPLALARTLMEAHGGRLEIVAAPGAGTRVSLILPATRRRNFSRNASRATQPSCATLPSA